MKNLQSYLKARVPISATDIELLHTYFTKEEVPAQTPLLASGSIERYLYFLSKGIVKGFQNIDGKIVIQHLVAEHDFFTSLESFMTQTPTTDYYETITPCTILKIAKTDFDSLQEKSSFWTDAVNIITNEHLNCKLERVKDFQILTAKERYLKFVAQNPKLALQVSIDNIASFLGIEPQSLSRIRKQIAF
ncbi:Crp/Fnr family transcriptional regulator [Cellulophaga baltica]|uniref:Crp/Fnr family transcriptional regulator n=1 Tax=Cellulophaga baltica TaxID=76594 RepID=UPI0021481C75|nr:Crp/Fnr family transcriptional regulator [Cellulophaga baltica]MCR1024133.1 Crp/Fnr family transcriptional regulator [Cellulophaga baltica]